jgi:hypothetical protein
MGSEGELVLNDVRSPNTKTGSWMKGVEVQDGPYSYTTEVSGRATVMFSAEGAAVQEHLGNWSP